MTRDTSCDTGRLSTRLVRWLLAGLAVLSFAIGWVGLFVPGLPTTIFWIVAVLCAGRACPVIREWVYRCGRAGTLVKGVVEERSLPRRAKRRALIGLWLCLGLSMAWLVWLQGPTVAVAWLLPIVGIGVSVYILRGLKTSPVGA